MSNWPLAGRWACAIRTEGITLFGYYLDLALRSLKRNPVLTGLMIVAIGFGIGTSMTSLSVSRAMSGDPIPEKSRQLFMVQIDSWGRTSGSKEARMGLTRT